MHDNCQPEISRLLAESARDGLVLLLSLFQERGSFESASSTSPDFFMASEYISALAFLSGALVAMVASCMQVARGMQRQREILKRGSLAQGRIIRVWRPPLCGAFNRIYFEFVPESGRNQVQACHLDRRSASNLTASLPAVGAAVGVRYLPDDPTAAVIAKLVRTM